MEADFLRCDAITSGWEGGNVDDPRDPGGRTSRGVTQARYDQFRAAHRLPGQDVYLMSEAERLLIYRDGYWVPVRGADLPPGVNLAVYDAAVNSGPGRAGRWLQQGVNDTAKERRVVVDGAVGPNTIGGSRTVPAFKLVSAVCARRRSFVSALKHFAVFGRGWIRRIADIEARGVAWALGKSPVRDLVLQDLALEANRSADDRQKAAVNTGGAGGGVATIGGVQGVPAEVAIGIVLFAVVVIGVFVLRARSQRERARAFRRVLNETEG